MNKQKHFIIAALLTALTLSACGSDNAPSVNTSYYNNVTAGRAPQATTAPGYDYNYGFDSSAKAEMDYAENWAYPEEAPMPAPEFGADLSARVTDSVFPLERKVILNGFINMRTEDYADASARIRSLTLGAGGFIESSNTYVNFSDGGRDYMYGYFTLRVPADRYEDTKADIEAIGQVVSTSDSSTDATAEYTDTESRVKSLRAQETSVLGMIEKATKVEDLILLEERLSDIRTDIELYQSRLNTIDRQASFSTLSVDITEVRVYEPIKIEPKTTWDKVRNSFIGSINDIISFFEGLLVLLAYLIIPLLLLAALTLLCWRILRRARRKNAQKHAALAAAAQINEEGAQK